MRLLPTALLVTCLLAACDRSDSPPRMAGGPSAAAPDSLLLRSEDLLEVQASRLSTGPVITGSVQPARRADLRAEVASVVTQVLKDNGQPVQAGDLLMRLDETSLRENLNSAVAAARAAEQGLTQAERQLDRLRTLQGQGMATAQALDDAGIRRNNASSDLAAARSRVVAARQQLQKTRIVAPFDGIVSDRRASVGDTAQVGKELVKVIDPSSMRFEGLVSADRLDELKVGQSVEFRINGFGDGSFEGTVLRIDPTVNATTRQVAVTVTFDEPAKAPAVAGLFAEGRIAGTGLEVPTVPDSALVRAADAVIVWRIDGRRLVRQPVRLGDRDPRSGLYPVLDGLKPGARILAHPTGSLADGQAIEFAPPAEPAAADTAGAPGASAAR